MFEIQVKIVAETENNVLFQVQPNSCVYYAPKKAPVDEFGVPEYAKFACTFTCWDSEYSRERVIEKYN
jgi:hypothetical protein